MYKKILISLFFYLSIIKSFPMKNKLGESILKGIKIEINDKIKLDVNNTITNEGLEGLCHPYSDEPNSMLKFKENLIKKEILKILLDKKVNNGVKLKRIEEYKDIIYNITVKGINLKEGGLLDDWETNIF